MAAGQVRSTSTMKTPPMVVTPEHADILLALRSPQVLCLAALRQERMCWTLDNIAELRVKARALVNRGDAGEGATGAAASAEQHLVVTSKRFHYYEVTANEKNENLGKLIEDLRAELADCDLDPNSRDILDLVTPLGQYQLKRLPMGVKCGPQAMSRILFHSVKYPVHFSPGIMGTDTWCRKSKSLPPSWRKSELDTHPASTLKCKGNPTSVIRASMERRQNEGVGEAIGMPTNGIGRHLRKSGDPAGNRARFNLVEGEQANRSATAAPININSVLERGTAFRAMISCPAAHPWNTIATTSCMAEGAEHDACSSLLSSCLVFTLLALAAMIFFLKGVYPQDRSLTRAVGHCRQTPTIPMLCGSVIKLPQPERKLAESAGEWNYSSFRLERLRETKMKMRADLESKPEPMRMKGSEYGAATECNVCCGKWEIPEKTRRPSVSSGTIPTCENPGVTPPGSTAPTSLLEMSLLKGSTAPTSLLEMSLLKGSTAPTSLLEIHWLPGSSWSDCVSELPAGYLECRQHCYERRWLRRDRRVTFLPRTRFAVLGGERSSHYTTAETSDTRDIKECPVNHRVAVLLAACPLDVGPGRPSPLRPRVHWDLSGLSPSARPEALLESGVFIIHVRVLNAGRLCLPRSTARVSLRLSEPDGVIHDTDVMAPASRAVKERQVAGMLRYKNKEQAGPPSSSVRDRASIAGSEKGKEKEGRQNSAVKRADLSRAKRSCTEADGEDDEKPKSGLYDRNSNPGPPECEFKCYHSTTSLADHVVSHNTLLQQYLTGKILKIMCHFGSTCDP
ncbi:hypothetical protein PR048_024325 [Dryococelus australis]|uniref:Uncharacterized protein n=1 Tax=Dryococelus australis TaxID=614101 RepID=A0ABQ9GN92_9NEOP|nr:hypothetical protein PR048_024325 [Dryococelus australis]